LNNFFIASKNVNPEVREQKNHSKTFFFLILQFKPHKTIMPSREKCDCNPSWPEQPCKHVCHPCAEKPFLCCLSGPRGVKGKAGSLLDYAEFYTITRAIVFPGSPVPFPLTGVDAGGGFIKRTDDGNFQLSPGTYRITWTISCGFQRSGIPGNAVELQIDGQAQDGTQTGESSLESLRTRTVLCKIGKTASLRIVNASPLNLEVLSVVSSNIVIECVAGF
jgi:hypothetical protein